MAALTGSQWEEYLRQFPGAHLLQTAPWGELKAGFGWQAERWAGQTAGAQILFRRLPLGFSMAYIPKGPVGEDWAGLWPEIDKLCRKHRAVFLKVEPDAWENDPPGFENRLPGFIPSPYSIQPRRTVVIDLQASEGELLARMKQKTRYNIHLAEKKGISVRESGDLAAFSRMMALTGRRDGFGTHSPEYYRRAYELFSADGSCALLLAEFQGQPIAGLMVFRRGRRAWYLYGASSEIERNRMPAYLLQWEAIRWAKGSGCQAYDLWGVPDADLEALEAGFESRRDGLWSVYRFKRGFGGELCRSAGAWDRVYRPGLYRLYRFWMARSRKEAA